MKKKWIFWVIAAVIFCGIGLYLKFAGFGDTLMVLFNGAIGAVIGWFARVYYVKYIQDDL